MVALQLCKSTCCKQGSACGRLPVASLTCCRARFALNMTDQPEQAAVQGQALQPLRREHQVQDLQAAGEGAASRSTQLTRALPWSFQTALVGLQNGACSSWGVHGGACAGIWPLQEVSLPAITGQYTVTACAAYQRAHSLALRPHTVSPSHRSTRATACTATRAPTAKGSARCAACRSLTPSLTSSRQSSVRAATAAPRELGPSVRRSLCHVDLRLAL